MSHHDRPTLARADLETARRQPFSTDVLGEDRIVCLECGLRLEVLGTHLRFRHRLTVSAYREKWGYNRKQGLSSARYAEKHRARMAGRRPPVQGRSPGARPSPPRLQGEQQRLAAVRRQAATRRGITIRQVVELYRAGYNNAQIAKLLGCSASVVHERLREVGLRARPQQGKTHVTREAIMAWRNQGLTWREVSWKLHCSRALIRNVLKKTGGPPGKPGKSHDIVGFE